MAQWTTIKTIFGQFCIDLFGKENGDLVYEVYYNILKFDIKQNKFKPQRDIKIEMQKTHINYLLENISKETFLAACKQIKSDYDSGNLAEVFRKSKSFTNFCLKFNINYKMERPFIPTEIIIKDDVIPIVYKRIESRTFSGDNERYNYDYKCSCNEIIDPWKVDCPKCNSHFAWYLIEKNK
jgi:hypothetical protein